MAADKSPDASADTLGIIYLISLLSVGGKIVGIPIVCCLECVFISVIVVPTVLDNGCCVTHRHCIPGNTADIYIPHFSIQSVTVNYN